MKPSKILTLLLLFLVTKTFAQLNQGLMLTIDGKKIPVGTASFGKEILPHNTPFCGQVVIARSVGGANPTTNTQLEACDSITNAADVSGKIALIRRGTCIFINKVAQAQKAGAIAVIIYETTANAATTDMTGTDTTLKIPCAKISLEDAQSIIAKLNAGNMVNACFTNPSIHISNVYGNPYAVKTPLSQAFAITPFVSAVNKTSESIENVIQKVIITEPDGTEVLLEGEPQTFEPTQVGFVRFLPAAEYQPTKVGVHKIKFFSDIKPDTLSTQFEITDYTFAAENGTVAGNTTTAPATFASTYRKIYSHLNYYAMGADPAKATYATFGVANAKSLKGRSINVSVWETSEEKMQAIKSSILSVGDIAEYYLGDIAEYTFTGNEGNLVTIPLTNGTTKYMDLEGDKVYILAVEYNGSSYKDSIAPQYTLGRTIPLRWRGYSIFGTAILTGSQLFTGGWNATADPIGRLHIDNFVGAKDLKGLAENEVSFFPNPTYNNVNVTLNLEQPHQNIQLGIMDFNGRILEVKQLQGQQDILNVDISKYPAGTYFFTLKTDTSFKTEKIIKQ